MTEADLDREGVGGVITDKQVLRCLGEFGDVDVIYLKRIRYGSIPLALVIFFFEILKSFSKPYYIYFSRGSISSFFLVSFNALTLKRRKIVKRALSVPLGSREVKFLKYGKLESFFRYNIFRFVEHFVYSQIDIVTVAAEVYEQELIEAGIKREKIYVMNFIAGEEFFDQPIKDTIEGPFNFCYVGGFHLYQDLQPVLEAFEILSKTHRDVELVFVGEGLQRPKLEEEATKRKLRHKLKFLGKIPHSSLPAYLSKMDCFISLTRKPGLSISIVEAAAAGKAIITFAPKNNLTYNNFFTHKKEIFLVGSISPEEIAKAMKLLYEDSMLRNAIAHGARKVAQSYFNEKVVREQLENLIRKIS